MNTATKIANSFADCVSGSFQHTSPLELAFGQRLTNTIISYAVYGDINKPAIVVLGGISADQYVADTNVEGIFVSGWWDNLVGYGKAIDLNHFCVISFSYLDGQSSDPQFNRFQGSTSELKLSTFDQAQVLSLLLKRLKIEKLSYFIGSSYGGMVGLAFAERYPKQVGQLIAICCTEESSAKNTAYRALQRQIIKFAAANNEVETGLELARSIAMLGYRGSDEIEERFKNQICIESQTIKFPVTGYLNYHGEKFAQKFDPTRFINLSLSVDLHKVNPSKITIPCLCVGIQGDHIAPSEKVEKLAKKLGPHGQYISIESHCGHDGFLTEHQQLIPIIKDTLEY
jgi:homoserine O-acetyltransferase